MTSMADLLRKQVQDHINLRMVELTDELRRHAPRERGRLASSVDHSGIIEVPISVDPSILKNGWEEAAHIPVGAEIISVANDAISQRFLVREANGAPRVVTVCEHSGEVAVDLATTGEVVAWWCPDCGGQRYADGW